jgi:tetratricopeptide (TPR) repeat protein
MVSIDENEVARRAESLFTLGFARAAIDVLEIALREDPDAGALWRLRAVLLQREGRRDEAFDNVQWAMMLAPLGQEALLVLADGYARNGCGASAADVFLQLAADDGLPSDLWEPVFGGLCEARKWQAALVFCRRMARERSDDDRVYFAMAHALGKLGRPPELSLNMIRTAIDLNPAEPRYRVALAMQQLRMGRPDDAYRSIVEISSEALASLTCRCCLQKALHVCINQGDGARAAAIAAQLAASTPTKRAKNTQEGHS